MGLHAFNCGANLISYSKNNKNYAMIVAWAMMVDYSKVALLMGGQADTSRNLELGDEIGISALSKGQEEIGKNVGSTHSSKINKLDLFPFEMDGKAILCEGAKTKMVGKVIKIDENEDHDKFVIVEITRYSQDENKEFAYGYDPKLY